MVGLRQKRRMANGVCMSVFLFFPSWMSVVQSDPTTALENLRQFHTSRDIDDMAQWPNNAAFDHNKRSFLCAFMPVSMQLHWLKYEVPGGCVLQ